MAAMLSIQLASASVKSPVPAFKEQSSFSSVASGYRNRESGALNNMGSNGNYWSSAPNSAANAYNLNFNSGNVNPLNNNNRANGFSVRPVRAFNLPEVYVSFLFDSPNEAMRLTRDELYGMLNRAYLDARKNERNKEAQLSFEVNLEDNLWIMADELYLHTYTLSPLICFMIDWPTRREVFAPAFRGRIVSHLLFNMIDPLFERTFIFDSYSCRKGKGTDFGIERFEHHLRSCTNNYKQEAFVLLLDISGYFMSINKGRLYQTLCSELEKYRDVYNWDVGKKWGDILDYDFVDYVIKLTLFRNPTENCKRIGGIERWEGFPANKSQFNSPLGTGLIIGDLDSQLEQNIYMNPFDQRVKRYYKCKHYCRYVDDSRIIHQSQAFLEDLIPQFEEFLWDELRLKLHPTKTKIIRADLDQKFLGACCKPYRRYTTNNSVASFHLLVNKLEDIYSRPEPTMLDDYYKGLSSLNSYLGRFRHFNEFKMLQDTLGESPLNNIFSFAPGYQKAMFNDDIKKMLKSQNYYA